MNKRQRLENNLTPQQIKTAEMLAANSLGAFDEGGKKISKTELAEKAGIGRTTLYNWLNDSDFSEYVNLLTDRHLRNYQGEIYSALLGLATGKSVPNGVPSVKALELFMKRFGMLTDRTIVEESTVETKYLSNEELEEDMRELDELLKSID